MSDALPPARRSLGQNFLVNRQVVRRIVETLAPAPNEVVLEIGPGRGALTGALLEANARVAAVERDPLLVDYLRERFGDGLVLFSEDVLRLDLARVCEELGLRAGTPIAVVGNLPYNISKPLAHRFVHEHAAVQRAVLMFQREVAIRLTADPGSRDYGPLSVLAAEAYDIRRVFDVPASSFRPRPRVVSSVTRWLRKADEGVDAAALRSLSRCLAACFARRRKTLRNNLRAALHGDEAVDRVLESSGLDGRARAETLSPGDFRRLAALLDEHGDGETADA